MKNCGESILKEIQIEFSDDYTLKSYIPLGNGDVRYVTLMLPPLMIFDKTLNDLIEEPIDRDENFNSNEQEEDDIEEEIKSETTLFSDRITIHFIGSEEENVTCGEFRVRKHKKKDESEKQKYSITNYRFNGRAKP